MAQIKGRVALFPLRLKEIFGNLFPDAYIRFLTDGGLFDEYFNADYANT